MATVPLTYDSLGGYYWQPPETLSHACDVAICEIVMMELPKVILELPVFIEVQGKKSRLVALMGSKDGKNTVIDPVHNKWLGRYVPAALRNYPFDVENTNKGHRILVDTETPLLNRTKTGHALYNTNGEPSDALQTTITALEHFATNRLLTRKAIKSLFDAGYLKPWKECTLSQPNGDKRRLLLVDESMLVSAKADLLAELFQTGALWLGHSQLLSMQHVDKVSRASALAATPPASITPITTAPISDGETIDLDSFL